MNLSTSKFKSWVRIQTKQLQRFRVLTLFCSDRRSKISTCHVSPFISDKKEELNRQALKENANVLKYVCTYYALQDNGFKVFMKQLLYFHTYFYNMPLIWPLSFYLLTILNKFAPTIWILRKISLIELTELRISWLYLGYITLG